MTNLQGNIKKSLENLYGLRTWIEYAFRQDKQELGWLEQVILVHTQGTW